MKAGTTFLFSTLGRHPGIYFTPEKEIHYFAHTQAISPALQRPLLPRLDFPPHTIMPGTVLNHDFRRRRLSAVMHNRFSRLKNASRVREIVCWYAERYLTDPIDEAWFDRAFEAAQDRWCAEFSNYNALLSDRGWAGVRRHCDQLRVMYVMRDPVERLWSHLKFELIPMGKREALVNGDLDEVRRFLASSSSAHARYGEIIASLHRNLAPEERFIVKLEDILADLPGQLDRLSDFLGVSRISYARVDPSKKFNPTEELAIPPNVLKLFQQVLEADIAFFNNANITSHAAIDAGVIES